ncbi:MAG TPA: DUF4178 domain-containing protein [Kofleriaceae bacterium]|nr:DUF4178 domain-containing protein [Kofleriaceae bacterium]
MILIVAALIVALGSGTVGVVRYVNQQKRALGGGGPKLALPVGGKLVERGLRELKVGDVVTIDGKDFLCEGVILYDEDGHRWVGARLVDGSDVRWCVVGLERVGNEQIRLLAQDPTEISGYPPEALVIGDVRYALDKRGTATCRVTGDLGNLFGARTDKLDGAVERCRWWLYSAPGDDTVVLEQWGQDYRALKGKKVAAGTLELIPGS